MRYYVEATVVTEYPREFEGGKLVDVTDGNARFRVEARSPLGAAVAIVNRCEDLDIEQLIAVQRSARGIPMWFRYDPNTDAVIEDDPCA